MTHWEDTLDGVAYGLGRSISTVGELPIYELIVRTVHQLPKDVREYVCEECSFVVAGQYGDTRVYGHVVPPGALQAWVIVLDGGVLEHLGGRSAASVIAHEIAHAWLKHNLFDPGLDIDLIEREAATLAKQWGFSGQGTMKASEEEAMAKKRVIYKGTRSGTSKSLDVDMRRAAVQVVNEYIDQFGEHQLPLHFGVSVDTVTVPPPTPGLPETVRIHISITD